MSLINPLTGRKIQYGGVTHRRLLQIVDEVDQALADDIVQHGGTVPLIGKVAEKTAKEDKDFFSSLLDKSKSLNELHPSHGKTSSETIVMPKSKYALISSVMPPAPEEHSWYHHHAPFAQNFGDYVCLKRSTLQDLGTFLHDSLITDVHP